MKCNYYGERETPLHTAGGDVSECESSLLLSFRAEHVQIIIRTQPPPAKYAPRGNSCPSTTGDTRQNISKASVHGGPNGETSKRPCMGEQTNKFSQCTITRQSKRRDHRPTSRYERISETEQPVKNVPSHKRGFLFIKLKATQVLHACLQYYIMKRKRGKNK